MVAADKAAEQFVQTAELLAKAESIELTAMVDQTIANLAWVKVDSSAVVAGWAVDPAGFVAVIKQAVVVEWLVAAMIVAKASLSQATMAELKWNLVNLVTATVAAQLVSLKMILAVDIAASAINQITVAAGIVAVASWTVRAADIESAVDTVTNKTDLFGDSQSTAAHRSRLLIRLLRLVFTVAERWWLT